MLGLPLCCCQADISLASLPPTKSLHAASPRLRWSMRQTSWASSRLHTSSPWRDPYRWRGGVWSFSILMSLDNVCPYTPNINHVVWSLWLTNYEIWPSQTTRKGSSAHVKPPRASGQQRTEQGLPVPAFQFNLLFPSFWFLYPRLCCLWSAHLFSRYRVRWRPRKIGRQSRSPNEALGLSGIP
jgi:hypothetical protein